MCHVLAEAIWARMPRSSPVLGFHGCPVKGPWPWTCELDGFPAAGKNPSH